MFQNCSTVDFNDDTFSINYFHLTPDSNAHANDSNVNLLSCFSADRENNLRVLPWPPNIQNCPSLAHFLQIARVKSLGQPSRKTT